MPLQNLPNEILRTRRPRRRSFFQSFAFKFFIFFLVVATLAAVGFLVPRKRPFDTYLKRAEIAFQNKNFDQAITLYLQSLKQYPEHEQTPQVLLLIGDIYNFSLGNYEQAAKAYQILTDQYPRTFENHRGLKNAAEMHQKLSNYRHARMAYQSLIENFPKAGDKTETQFQVALMDIKLKNFEAARTELMGIIDKNPNTPMADKILHELGNIYFMEGAPDRAIKLLRVAIEKYPNSPLKTEMQFTLANAYEETNRPEKAVKLYQKIQDEYPNPMVIESKLLSIAEREKENELVKKQLKEAALKKMERPKSKAAIKANRAKSLNNADKALSP